MNAELNKELLEILKASKEGALNIASLVQNQAPELFKEIISWTFWDSLFWAIASPIFILIVLFLHNLNLTWYQHIEENNRSNPMPVLIWAFLGASTLFLFAQFIDAIQELIKCLVAPKLVIIDYIHNLTTAKL